MNHTIKPASLKIFTLAAALLGYLLRYLLYATAIDQKGLIVSNHWASWGLGGLTVLFLAAMFLLVRNPEKEMRYEESFDSSFLQGWGCWILAAAVLLHSIRNLDSDDPLTKYAAFAGIAAGIGLLVVGVYRFMGSKPHFLCPSAVSIYFALRTVGLYRTWSSDPQLMDYGFYLAAFICLMLSGYFLAQFHVNPRSHRPLWITAMAAVYFCAVAIPESRNGIFLLACAVWAFTCTPRLAPKPRRQRPALRMDEED